jgi:hypothetical protein
MAIAGHAGPSRPGAAKYPKRKYHGRRWLEFTLGKAIMEVRVQYLSINLVTNPSSLLDSPTVEDGTIADPHDCGVSIPRITVEGKTYRDQPGNNPDRPLQTTLNR